jgi:SWI/SNF-related matrix-associated actin-dependent regulator of chromatin subfamily A3
LPPAPRAQWRLELAARAPSLVVRTWHNVYKSNTFSKSELVDLRDADVILTVATTQGLPYSDLVFPRVIVDEAHAFKSNKGQVARAEFAWGVSGTPYAKPADLEDCACLLARSTQDHAKWHDEEPAELLQLRERIASAAGEDELAEYLRTIMIRHTKAQLIGGVEALALPAVNHVIVWLHMSTDERALYDELRAQAAFASDLKDMRALLHEHRNACSYEYSVRAVILAHDAHAGAAVTSRPVNQALRALTRLVYAPAGRGGGSGASAAQQVPKTLLCWETCTKLRALHDDLAALLAQQEPKLHAIVLTHSSLVQAAVVACLGELHAQVLNFGGETRDKERHKMVKIFQEGGAQALTPKVLVMRLPTGVHGLNLTAATRVYLMEPSLDPAIEDEAIGLVHRLGQARDVLVVHFAFRDSVEERVLALHDEVRAGTAELRHAGLTLAQIKRLLAFDAAPANVNA